MRNYRSVVKGFVIDQDEASEYLKVALEEYEEDGNLDAFLKAIRTVADAQGGISKLAEKTNLNRQHLYRSLSENGNPTIRTLDSILHSLGLKLSLTRAS
ncbi:MAG: putative addiction module antidote protein [Spirochaetales bacterium]|nr:putative addiction module antidote protein [Spirochaetales bacterium]